MERPHPWSITTVGVTLPKADCFDAGDSTGDSTTEWSGSSDDEELVAGDDMPRFSLKQRGGRKGRVSGNCFEFFPFQ